MLVKRVSYSYFAALCTDAPLVNSVHLLSNLMDEKRLCLRLILILLTNFVVTKCYLSLLSVSDAFLSWGVIKEIVTESLSA